MSMSRTGLSKDAPQSHKGREQKLSGVLRQQESPLLSPAAALQILRSGGRLSHEHAMTLSHTLGNRALEELLSQSNAPALLERPLPGGDVETPPLSVPDNAPEAVLAPAPPVWGSTADAAVM